MSLVKNLFYKAGDFELNIPEWAFSDKSFSALTGSSGSGKTTIVKILCGLLPCRSLEWRFKGKNMSALPLPERNLGVCFQDLRLFPNMSAGENILFPLRARKISLNERKKDFKEIVGFLGLEKCLNLSVEKLSGGERNRAALARALIVRPRFLFLDEPFSYLDESAKAKARALTKELVKKYSLPGLIISHDKEDAAGLAEEEFCLINGKISKKRA